LSTRTPTQSELQTFQVLANQEFTNFGKRAPTATVLGGPRADDVDGVFEVGRLGEASREHSVARPPSRQPSPAASQRSRVSVQEGLWGGVPEFRRPTPPLGTPERTVQEPELQNGLLEETAPQEWRREVSTERRREVSTERRDEAAHGTSSAEWASAKKEAEIDVAIEKEALLYELELMEKQGNIQLHRKLSMSDTLESIQYQYDRANMIINTQQTVDWAKGGIKFGSMMLEAGLKRFGIGIVDGFSKNLTQDMTKFNRPLTKMYRKYWRRGTSSPEMELAMIVFGALAMTVVGNSNLLGGLFGGGGGAKQQAAPGAAFGGLAAASGPSGQSALRPPPAFGGAPSVAPAASTGAGAGASTAAVPEWARAAIAAGPPAPPQHFARVVPPQPEQPEPFSVRNAPLPVMPVPARVLEMRPPEALPPAKPSYDAPSNDYAPQFVAPQAAQQAVQQAAPPPTVRRLTLNSPTKSSRKRREPVQELNLDDE
jgi:hypothetical protein